MLISGGTSSPVEDRRSVQMIASLMKPLPERVPTLDRVRRISEELLQKYPGVFGTDYQANKEQLNRVALVHSKMLRNKIAGYITKMNGRAAEEEEEERAGAEEEVQAEAVPAAVHAEGAEK